MPPHHRLLSGLALLLLLIDAAPPALAAEPAAPWLSGYADAEAFEQQIADLRQRDHLSVRSLGETQQRRAIHLVTVHEGDGGDGEAKPDNKPAILIVGSVHAPHLLGSELTVRLARRLASDNKKAAALRRRFTFYLIPRPSPDASARVFDRPIDERAVNTRPVDADNDGRHDEDGADDLNGDGLITAMRVQHPSGRYIPHPDEPRLLIEADRSKGERGRYKLYETEGGDNDGDEQFNEDGPGGVDFNRNFTFDYPYFEPAAGPHQVSEPATRAVADFAFDHPNIAAVFCFSPNDNLFHVWGAKPAGQQGKIKSQLTKEDEPEVRFLAEKYRKLHGGKHAPKPVSKKGTFSRWAYFHYGRWSLAARGWWPPKIEPEEGKKDNSKKKPDSRAAQQRNHLRWLKRQDIDGFVEWTEIDHPDFPDRKAEVGGFKPLLTLNPPADKLDELAKKHHRFIRELAQRLPRVKVREIEVEPLGGDVHRITATVVNTGYLPTMPKIGEISEWPHPLQLVIRPRKQLKFLRSHHRVRIGPIAGSGGTAEHTWLIRTGVEKLTVRAYSPSVGSHRKTVKLP